MTIGIIKRLSNETTLQGIATLLVKHVALRRKELSHNLFQLSIDWEITSREDDFQYREQLKWRTFCETPLCLHDEIRRNSSNLRSLNGEVYRPSRRRIFLFRNRSSSAAEQFHNDASLEAPNEHRTTRKTGSRRRKVTSAHNDRHLLRMAVSDRTASSRQFAARWSTATGVLMSASSVRRCLMHRGLRARVPLYRIPLTANHRRLLLQWALAN
ncbi:transposable element Tcb2 transposase [Trichonephila clavipes]|nr:transposable element Tcb2 transposase [Trichonephila clavipes]